MTRPAERSPTDRAARATLAVGIAFLFAGCSGGLPSLDGLSTASLQSLARVGASTLPISDEKEVEIGRSVAATVVGREPLLHVEAVTRYVELVGQAVAQQSVRRGEVRFHFGVLDTDDINAYAAPGGYIFITRGTLELLGSEAQLAAVLAHEIAHVDSRHVIEELRRADVLRTAREETELTGALLDRVAGMGSSLLFTGLSRGDEMEADSLGLLYTASAGYRSGALITVLERMEADSSDPAQGGRLREMRATHPPASERLEALRRIAARMPPNDGVELADRYRERVGSHLTLRMP